MMKNKVKYFELFSCDWTNYRNIYFIFIVFVLFIFICFWNWISDNFI